MSEEKLWSVYYRFEVKDEEGCSLDSDIIKGKREAISKAKLSYRRLEGALWNVYNLENELVNSSTTP